MQVLVLSKEQILSVDDMQYRDVSVPEWGGVVRLKSLSGMQRDRLEAEVQSLGQGKGLGSANLRAKFAQAAIVDSNGKRMFEAADLDKLGRKSAAALSRVFTVIVEMNAMTKQDVEDLAGESEAGQAGDSSSDSASS